MSDEAPPAGSSDSVRHARDLGLNVLVVGVALIALQNFPPLPIRGAQLSDGIAGLGAPLVLATTLRIGGWSALVPSRAATVAAVGYALFACVSFATAGGSAMRLLGYVWLVGFGFAVSVAGQDADVAQRLRRALIVAALIGAVTGLVGAVLFWTGKPTGLLNIAGDLVPGNYPRIRGTLGRANALAGLLATGLLLVGDVPRRWRVPVAIVLAVALVFTFSRSWIALGASGAVWWLALTPKHTRMRDIAAVLVVLATIAVMLAVSWLEIRVDPTRPFATTIGDGVGTRWIHLNDALSTISAHPLGVGPGRAATYNGWDAHFSPINIAAVIGIPAAIAFVVLFALALVRSIRAARDGDIVFRGVAAALVLFGIDALARDIEDQRALWVLLGLALVGRVRRR
ncbi:MAG TPA: hypothetical protein VFV99_04530 [Kofleriaceae bacterium]|nr:hypothetical protein [Kofleriaceae bacterium]